MNTIIRDIIDTGEADKHYCICRAPAEYYVDIQATPTSIVLLLADLQMTGSFNQDEMQQNEGAQLHCRHIASFCK